MMNNNYARAFFNIKQRKLFYPIPCKVDMQWVVQGFKCRKQLTHDYANTAMGISSVFRNRVLAKLI